MFAPADLFDLAQTEHAHLFAGAAHAWEALKAIEPYIAEWLKNHPPERKFPEAWIGEQVWIGEGTVIEPGAMIKGPAIIGRNCQVRHNAYIREQVIVGDGCVVGNSCELNNALLFNNCQVPHFNYVGDSILGHKAHLGAGVILSNFRSLPGTVKVEIDGQVHDTGLRKFGALIGDGADIGCNAVLNPGSIIGRRTVIYPGVCWRGVAPAGVIIKNRATIEVVPRKG
ncbi:MAG TPA: UDP-N-acetylglucosamine diphosphorylase [Verrucomicrobiota bacterium]|nr:UDP-N-acetylglucosamine diphosphorylase [Verrucomicrobiota bacterium]